ncbi:MAG TPA: hypothetical protein VEC99_08515, partial [Clostridia bacterium]|nr:hypothetical protein [Clostridia bacterium]
MRRILQVICIAIACSITHGSLGVDYTACGDLTICNADTSDASALMTVSFTLTRVGTNWSTTCIYTNANVKQTIALVDGSAYSASWDFQGTYAGGLVMDNPINLLDSSTIFTRALIMAFLTPKQSLEGVTNVPVPFLGPRHAGLYCYRWTPTWSPEPPFLMERVRFDFDKDLMGKVSADAINYCFRSGYKNRRLFSTFGETQRAGAEYSVEAWTNALGLNVPLRSSFRFTTFDALNGEKAIPQVLVITLKGISPADRSPLIPTLTLSNGVQHIINRTCYYYTSPDGTFLPAEQAKAVGQVLKPA